MRHNYKDTVGQQSEAFLSSRTIQSYGRYRIPKSKTSINALTYAASCTHLHLCISTPWTTLRKQPALTDHGFLKIPMLNPNVDPIRNLQTCTTRDLNHIREILGVYRAISNPFLKRARWYNPLKFIPCDSYLRDSVTWCPCVDKCQMNSMDLR